MINQFFFRFTNLMLVNLFLALFAACEPSIVTIKPAAKVPTAGEKIHEALVVAQVDSPCAKEKVELLESRRAEIVPSINLLLADPPLPALEETLFQKRLQWIANAPLEDSSAQLAYLLRDISDPIDKELSLLFPGVNLPLPSSEKLWKAVLFLKRNEVRQVDARLREGLSDQTIAILQKIYEIAESDRGRFVLDTFFDARQLFIPSLETSFFINEFLQREDIQNLSPVAVAITEELLEPSEQTRNILDKISAIQTRLNLQAQNIRPKSHDLQAIFEIVKSDELRMLAEGLNEKKFSIDAQNIFEKLMPFHDFIRGQQATEFIKYSKRFLTDEKTRKFMFDLSDFAQSQRGYFEHYFLSLCLGESWTSYMPGRTLCVQRMKWAGLDGDLSREFLDHVSPLYQNGLIQKALDLEAALIGLKYKYRDELSIATTLIRQFPFLPRSTFNVDPRSYFETEENRGAAIFYFEELVEKSIDKEVFAIFNFVKSFYLRHQQAIHAILKIVENDFSPRTVSSEKVNDLCDFFTNENTLQAINALNNLLKEGLFEELKKLYHIVSYAPKGEENFINALRILGEELDIGAGFPSRKTIRKAYTFINDQEKLESSKSLFKVLLTAINGFSEFRSVFTTFPMEPIDIFSDVARDQFFESLKKVREDHVTAFVALMKTGFDVWSLSENQSCKLPLNRAVKLQSIGAELKNWSHYLLDENHGFRSTLSLVKRIAKDTPPT